MAQMLQFPSTTSYAQLRVRNGRRHKMSIVILDRRRPKTIRWHTQFAIQRAASFRALKGFTDRAASLQIRHTVNRHPWTPIHNEAALAALPCVAECRLRGELL
jgi:hypothetical protein